jgi:exopolysaccharide biosynthesis polyprenyl glycosylphosphotransferase
MTVALERTTAVVSSRAATHRVLAPIALLIDLAVLSAAVVLAAAGRAFLEPHLPGAGSDTEYLVRSATFFIIAAWGVCLVATGSYASNRFGSGVDEYKVVVQGTVLAAAVTGIGCYVMRYPLPRAFFVLVFVLGAVGLVAGRFALRRSLYRLRARGHFTRRVLVAGTRSHVEEIVAVLERESWLGYRVVGRLTPAGLENPSEASVPTLGGVDAVRELALSHRADVVFLAGGASESAAEVRQILWNLERSGVEVIVAPSVTDVSRERISVRPVAGLPLVHLAEPRTVAAGRISKRFFDIAGAGLGLLLISPLLLLIALWIKLHDGGPVFYKQSRVGRDGRLFDCFKFRSMVSDADAMLDQLRDNNDFDDVLFKLKEDPRITAPGRLLRRFSLDELPQLLNVVHGDMSLVGPRPPLEPETQRYAGDDASPACPAGHHRPVADLRALGPHVVRDRAPRPLLRRQLVDAAGPGDPLPHRLRRLQRSRRLLTRRPRRASGGRPRPARGVRRGRRPARRSRRSG